MPRRSENKKSQEGKALDAPVSASIRPGKDAALQIARRRFMAFERVDAGEIAAELGINRATIYRWFGGRDELLIETLWSLCQDEMAYAERRAKGKGIEWMIDGLRLFVGRIAVHRPYQQFLQTEPEAAARALFTADDSIRHRIVAVASDYARRHAGFLASHIDPEPLAMAVVRVGEAFLYGDHIGKGVPKIIDLIKIYRLLLRPDKASPPTPRRSPKKRA